MKQLVVVGLGLIGGSIALGAREAQVVERIVGIDLGPVLARARGAVDDAVEASDARAVGRALAAADLVVLATPVTALKEWLPRALEAAVPVTDTGSTKRSLRAAVQGHPSGSRYIPGHPMAGAPAGGFERARADLFHGQRWILCPEGVEAEALECVERLVAVLGATALRMSAAEHDRAVALTSHVPQLTASALAALASDCGADRAGGTGFASATRVAGADVAIWRDIFETNADEIEGALTQLIGQLEQVSLALREEPPNLEPAIALLERARRARGG